jgi:hypothetical protein
MMTIYMYVYTDIITLPNVLHLCLISDFKVQYSKIV